MFLLPVLAFGQGVPVGVGVPGVGVGIGTIFDVINEFNDYPSPYANKAADYRAVYLLKGDEIFGYGEPQAIRSLWFEVDLPEFHPLYNYTIRMKHTHLDELHVDSITDDGLVEVYGPQAYIEKSGLNEHRFHRPFCWDGSSNVIIDICVQNDPSEVSQNAGIQVITPEPGTNMSYHDWQNTGGSLCAIQDQTNNAEVYEIRPVIYTSSIHADSLDLRAVASSSPEAIVELNEELVVKLRFQNYGCKPAVNPLISYSWNGLPTVTEEYVGTVQPGEYIDFEFGTTILADSAGFQVLDIWVDNRNDFFPTNDAIKKLVWVREGEYVGLDFTGKDFWIGFMKNYDNDPSKVQKLFLTSAFTTTATVSMPLLGWQTSVSIPQNGVAEVLIPNMVGGEETGTHQHDVNSPTGIHVLSPEPISVYGVSSLRYTTDAYLAVPYRSIGAQYVVSAPMGIYNATDFIGGSPLIDAPAEILVVAAEDNTKINVVSPFAIQGYAPGDTLEFFLDRGETRLLKGNVGKALGASVNTVDLSGTIVWGDKRFSVFGGAACAMVPGIMNIAERCDACDHLVEQMPAKNSLGKKFYLTDFSYKTGQDIVRVIASTFPTSVTIGGQNHMLSASDPFVDVKFEGELAIVATEPVLVEQLCTGGNCLPQSPTDPFMVNVLPQEQWGTFYTFTTPAIQKFNLHFINVVKKSYQARVGLDGQILPLNSFHAVPGTDFYAAKLAVQRGSHLVTGDSVFSVYAYGFGYAESYGYPASGGLMEPLAIDSLSLTVNLKHNPCLGNSLGEVDLTVFGGIPPYTYDWSNGDSIEDPVDLPSGFYTVEVGDDRGQTATLTLEILDPTGTIWETRTQDLLCFQDFTGSIEVDTLVGNGPLQIVWGDGVTDYERTSLDTGQYTFTIIDRNLCEVYDTVYIDQPPPLVLEVEKEDLTCFQSDNGRVALTHSGGTTPYQVLWSDADTNVTRNDLSAGTYSFTTTDKNNCALDSIITLTEPDALQWESEFTHPTCNGVADGEIGMSNMVGGTQPYVYRFQGEEVTDSTHSNLSAGEYTVSITDENGCFLDHVFTLENQNQLAVEEVEINPSVCGKQNGSIVLRQSDGLNNAGVFVWEGTSEGGDGELTGLWGDQWYHYQLLETPCVLKDSVFLPATPPLRIEQLNIDHATCGNDNGKAQIQAGGDEAPYSYWWYSDPVQYGSQAYGLPEGDYTVIVYSANCVVDSSITIVQTTGFEVDEQVTPSECSGNTGSILIEPTGGSGSFTYQWQHDPNLQGNYATDLPSGLYSVTVDDGNCIQTKTVEVGNVDGPDLLVSAYQTSCGLDNGGLSIAGVGGNSNGYVFSLNNQVIEPGQHEGLPPGMYEVYLTDGVCEVFREVEIRKGKALSVALVDRENARCGEQNGYLKIRVSDNVGTPSIGWSDGVQDELVRSGLTAGLYSVTVTDANCKDSLTMELTNADGPEVEVIFQNPSCGQSNGQIQLVDSAVSPYSYSWSSGHTDSIATGLSEGNYFITVESEGCEDFIQVNLENSAIPQLLVDTLVPATCLLNNGWFRFGLAIDAEDATYYWNNTPIDTTVVFDLSGNTEHQIIVDELGCRDTLMVPIPAIPLPEIVIDEVSASYCYDHHGAVRFHGEAGDGDFSWDLNGSEVTAGTIQALDSGWHHLVMHDAHCTVDTFFHVGYLDPIQITTVDIDSAHCDRPNGRAEIQVVSDSTYYVLWDNQPGGMEYVGIGDVQVQVYDHWCADTLDIFIPGTPNVIAAVDEVIPVRCDTILGSARLDIVQFQPPLAIKWDGIDSNVMAFSGLERGNHEVHIQDLHCDTLIPFFVDLVNPYLIPRVQPDTCLGGYGTLELQTGFFNGPTHTWLNREALGTTFFVDSLLRGTYVVEVEDSLGCKLEKTIVVDNEHLHMHQAIIDADPSEPEPMEKVQFRAYLPEGWDLSYWEFGNGSATNELIPEVAFGERGYYSAFFVAEHEYGCIDSLEIMLKIEPKVHIYLPSSFTPNGDGYNDFFFPVAHNVVSVQGGVFNRWGEEIFVFDSLEDRWDGTYKGTQSPIGTYAVRLVFKDVLNQVHEVMGKVTLVR